MTELHWIGTSWKMNKTLAQARVFADGLIAADPADTTTLQLFDAQGVHPMPAADKLTAARRLVAEIATRLPPRGPLTA